MARAPATSTDAVEVTQIQANLRPPPVQTSMDGGNLTACACDDSAGHASILWSGEVEDVSLTSLVFGCLVVITLGWEYTTEKLEEALEEHGAYKELLEKVYRELTLLGLISFGLFIKKDTTHMSPHLLHAFEFAHYLIFFMAMFFVLFALLGMRGCLAAKRQWDLAAAASVHRVCDAYAARLHRDHSSWINKVLRHLGFYETQLSFSQEQQAIEWFILRVMFLREYGISIHFDFSKYARKSLTNTITSSIRITPGTWTFMLCCLLLFAGVDILQNVEYVNGSDSPSVLYRAGDGPGRRVLAADSRPVQSRAHVHIVAIAAISWLALFVQLMIVLLLRQRLRLLLQSKLHILNYTEGLIPQLKENVQMLQMEAQEAETHGHDHLPARHESIDSEHDGLRLNYESKAYSMSLEKRVLLMSHCTSLWSCFALAYYCMGLVAAVGRTGWTTVNQVIAHTVLLLPHVILALRVSPALMKHHALLSSVIRRSDEIVATVVSQMERHDRLRDTLRRKLVDAHRQHQELEDEPSTPTAAALRLRLASKKQHHHLSQLKFSARDVENAAQWWFKKISGGEHDRKIAIRKIRIGLHWINAYFTDYEWKAMVRLLDPGHNLCVQLSDIITALSISRDGADSASHSSGDGDSDLESNSGKLQVITPDQWMFENVDDINMEMAAIAAVPLFSAVAQSSNTFLKDLRKELTRRRVPVGDFIIRKGDDASEMYFLTRGTVDVLRSSDDSAPITTLHSGSSFGETALVSQEKRNAFIRATAGFIDKSIDASGRPFIELYVLSRDGLNRTLDQYPAIRTALKEDIQQRYGQLDNPGISESIQPHAVHETQGQEPQPEPEPEPDV